MLRRDGAIVLAGLAALWGLTTVWLLSGAGLGMDIGDMTRMAWLPQHHASPRGDMAGMDMRYVFEPWTAARVALLAAMWWTMMVAMMTPSAAPAVLLYARVHRHAAGRGAVGAAPPVAAFVAGYVVAWGGFAVAATALQLALHAGGVLSAMTMGLPGRGVAATVWSRRASTSSRRGRTPACRAAARRRRSWLATGVPAPSARCGSA